MSTFLVFAVDNADRLTLLCPPTPQGPQFKQIALSFISAPRVAKRTQSGDFTEEDACAYDAMELIRAACIGKQVKFREDFVIQPLQRSSGQLTLPDGKDAAKLLLSSGLATVSDHMPPNMPKALFEEYHTLMAEAKTARIGVFAPNAAKNVRRLVNQTPGDTIKLAEQLKGKEHLMRIERILSPGIVVVSGSLLKDTQLVLHVTGITSKDLPADVLAEAKFFTEKMLLHRNVDILVDGVDTFGTMLGSVTSKKCTFQEELLSRGFVKLNPSTIVYSSRSAEMRSAEREAQVKRLKVWKDYVGTAATGSSSDGPQIVTAGGAPTAAETAAAGIPVVSTEGPAKVKYTGPVEFEGTIVQFVSGDTVGIRHSDSIETTRVSLAGVRVSRNVVREQDGKSAETRVKYNDYTWEAKEFLRTSFIGSAVKVVVEYARVIPVTNEVRPCATVVTSDGYKNIAAALLETGFASFFLGKSDVCSAAVMLQRSEEQAKGKKLGVHGKVAAAPTTVVELGRLGDARGKYYLSFLQRGMQGNRPPTWRGVVDTVIGGSAMRVYIPREHFQIGLKLSGVISPSTGTGSEVPDPFAAEAKDLAVTMLQQREVDIQVFASDKTGSFIGKITTLNGVNFAEALVAAGLAKVANAERLPFFQQLIAAEKVAQDAKKGIWSGEGNMPQRAVKMETQRAQNTAGGYTPASAEEGTFARFAIVETGSDGTSVYLRKTGEAVARTRGQIESLVNQCVGMSAEYHPKRGELIVVQYADDKTWNRGRVQRVRANDDTAEVTFIDFGTTSEVHVREMRPIPRGAQFDLLREHPPLATLAPLAYIKPKLPSSGVIGAASDCMYEYTDGEVLAKVAYTNVAGRKFYTVTVNENAPSLSESLLQAGVALLDKHAKSVDSAEFRRHEAAQEIARKGRKMLWQYGDVDDESDDGY